MLSVAIQLYTNGSDPACELRMPTAKRLVLTRRKGRELLVSQRESFPRLIIGANRGHAAFLVQMDWRLSSIVQVGPVLFPSLRACA